MLDVGWVDHSCMYFTPIRFGILSRTNQIAACIYGSSIVNSLVYIALKVPCLAEISELV